MFTNLESDLNNVLAWLNINLFKANPGKFQFMVLGTKEAGSFLLTLFGMGFLGAAHGWGGWFLGSPSLKSVRHSLQ